MKRSKGGFSAMARILVLDDVEDAVILIQRILVRKGHQVIGFTDELQAIAYARSNEVDLLILDIKLKKLSGIEVLEEIKKANPGVKAVMLTGYPTLETAREAKELGAQEYCVKPVEKEELEEKVAHVLGLPAG
jgi:DNA-binding NtrC family response regulator